MGSWLFVLLVLLATLVIGGAAVKAAESALREHTRLRKDDPVLGNDPNSKSVPPWIFGFSERTIFMLLTWQSSLDGNALTSIVMLAILWVGLKLALNWRRREAKGPICLTRIIRHSHISCILSLLSVGTGIAGGLLVAWTLSPIPLPSYAAANADRSTTAVAEHGAFGQAGNSLSPLWTTVYDFQTLITGILALIAGLIVIWAARINAGAVRDAAERSATVAREATANAIRDGSNREFRRLQQDRAQVCGALIGEIGALVTIAEKRRMVESYEQAVSSIESYLMAGKPTLKTPKLPKYPLSDRYFDLYESIGRKLGLLSGDLPREITEFYTLVTSIFDTLAAVSKGRYTEPETAVKLGRSLVDDLKAARAKADDLLIALHREREAALNARSDSH